MTKINLTQNKFLTHMLANMVAGLSLINKQDPTLRQVISKLNVLLANPNQLSGEELLDLINHAKEVVVSYGIEPKGDKPSEDLLSNLPGLFYNAVNEIDNMITKEYILDKASTNRKVATLWEKLANYHSAIKP